MLLEQRVVDVMARVALVAGEIDRAIDVDRQIGIDLDQAAEVALVPVVAAPRLVGDVLDGEVLAGRQRDVRQRALAARADRRLEHRVELLARNHERAAPRVVPLDQRSGSREALFETIEDGLEVRIRIGGRDRVVERLRLVVERQVLALEHAHARAHRGELLFEILMPQPRELVRARRRRRHLRLERLHVGADRVERQLRALGLLLDVVGAVVRVHVVCVVLPHGEDQPHVLPSNL